MGMISATLVNIRHVGVTLTFVRRMEFTTKLLLVVNTQVELSVTCVRLYSLTKVSMMTVACKANLRTRRS